MRFVLYSHNSQHLSRISEDIGHDGFVPCSSIERLKAMLPKINDIIFIDFRDYLPSTVNNALSSIHSIVALYDRSIQSIPALLSYQHTIYLPYDYDDEELGKALEKAEKTANEIGTIKDTLVGDSPVMEALRNTINLIIKARTRIFHISGETGTGKNLVAKLIHGNLFSKNKKSI